jgi:ketosteroid isomerase-like protein
MSLSADEEARIRKTVEALEEEEIQLVLAGDVAGAAREMADDVAVNAPNNQVVHKPEILEHMKRQTALQYSSVERRREAMVIRRDCVVTMGYEIVVPTGNVPNSGKTINRRYTNIYHFDDGQWRIIARQATNVSVK